MNVIEAKQKVLREFENYLQMSGQKSAVMYAAVSAQTGDVLFAETHNGALNAGLKWTFKVFKRNGEDSFAILADY